ncbi:MAG TPA: carboxypeptidase regulatory-like domain-containing protein [Vicinamibacterales bacterium]|nr:carboxypeptidase regulatory-like domain-containing protein [Vicinamibacterales bacterium]
MFRGFASLLLVVLCAVPAFAQGDRGQITGFVKDQSGAVIPGATVTATNSQTRLQRVAVTDANGYYVLPALPPGIYEVVAELDGFKKWAQTGVTLDAAASATVQAVLEPGTISEVITVTAEATPLQTDVAVRKTVEAKDIELMAFSGRNPIGVVGLKAGVMGGAFNSRGFDDLGNGGFNINGSRPDENTISIDGAIGVRTRSTGTIIGIQNVDAVQEVQVLTANYMPEYGRASGGQIRFVTKSGSSRYTGSGSFFYRDESLQANTWTRNRSTNPAENAGPAPFDFKQYGYALGGPVPGSPFTNRFFFFTAQEWVDYFALDTNTAIVPTEAMRRGDFSELLNPNNGFFNGTRVINDPVTGQPFPGNIIPSGRLSPNGLALLGAYPMPTPGFRQGTANLIQTSENPRDQRKDTIRLDYRLNSSHQVSYRYSASDWVAIDAFRGTFPFARTDWHRPNSTQILNWTASLRNNLLNETSYSFSLDEVFINVFTGSGLHQRSRTGINYPYIFPGKEIDDKLPTVAIAGFSTIDGGPYPAFSRGPIHAFTNTTTWLKGRHTLKAGVIVEYSGEDDFDQINVSAIPGGTNNQNGSFEFLDNRGGGSGLAIANVALGLFSNYAEIGQRAFTKWRALATDVFVQDSWKPRDDLTIEGGIRWAFWPPWYSTTNNIAHFDPAFYDPARAAVINVSTGRLVGGDRYNGIVLPGDGFEGDVSNLVVAQDPRVLALFRGQPRGFSQMHYNAIEPRVGLAYSLNERTVLRASAGTFHNRVTLNDSTLLGGNPPFQPMVTVANGIVDNPAGVGGGATDLPFGVTAQDPVFKHPTAHMWSAGVQREVPFGFVVDVSYVGRRGLNLQRERNINQLTAGTLQANPGVNIAALRPYKGYGAIRLSENAGRSIYHSLQISADRRYSNGLKVGAAYTLGKSMDNSSNKRDVLFNTYDEDSYWGPSSYDRRHVFGFHYIYDLPFWQAQDTLLKVLLGGWQISGASFFRTGTPFSVLRTNDIAGVGDGAFGQPYNVVGDPTANSCRCFSSGSDNNFWFNPAAFVAPAAGTFGNASRNLLYNHGQQQWDIALFKNFALRGSQRLQFRAEIFNFPNHPNLGNAQTGTVTGGGAGFADPTNANFGRVTTKTNDRREIQLSLRYQF